MRLDLRSDFWPTRADRPRIDLLLEESEVADSVAGLLTLKLIDVKSFSDIL